MNASNHFAALTRRWFSSATLHRAPITRAAATQGYVISNSRDSKFSLAPQANSRGIRATHPQQSTVLLGGLGVAAAALSARYLIQALEKSKAARAEEPESTETTSNTSSNTTTEGDSSTQESGTGSASGSFGATMFARRFYKGGFESVMTRREAALILGVRESASQTRIRERHRKLLIMNHPDMGGSTFIAGKINEAKDVLSKGAK